MEGSQGDLTRPKHETVQGLEIRHLWFLQLLGNIGPESLSLSLMISLQGMQAPCGGDLPVEDRAGCAPRLCVTTAS